MSVEVLAHARRIATEAVAAHAAALNEVDQVEARLAQIDDQQRAITGRRLAGESNPAEAGEFAALGGDKQTLQELLSEARARAHMLDPEPAQIALAQAEREHRREMDEAEFDAILVRLRMIEGALLQAIALASVAGAKIG